MAKEKQTGWSQEAIDVAALIFHAAEVQKSGRWCFHIPAARKAAEEYARVRQRTERREEGG